MRDKFEYTNGMSWGASILCSCVALCFLCLQCIYAGEHGNPNVCSYTGVCTKEKVVHGQTVTKRYLCKKLQSCETTWGPWGQCNEFHGFGYRRRVGRCVGTRCDKLVKQVERCDPNPPPTPSTPPPPPPTTTPEPDVDGNWSPWEAWVTDQCTVSCCEGTQSRTRTRACDNPPQSGNGQPCPGPSEETEDGIVCNTQECPLSCAMFPVGTIFNDPCVECSPEFRSCAGPDEPVPGMCPAGQNWSPAAFKCQSGCDPVDG